ncbi:MAG: type II toxin-antitoxin system RelB/DinJ family antitoxin [Clostridiales bacterium]|jgi:DNA-damage-inducible protein J|nr:type II toxin-antitoxin system RelB/DinJ family antitoxin [Clostridiales bacterium]
MAKTSSINIRVDPEIKISAEQVFSRFGISLTEAVNIFLHKSIMEGGLPFELKPPCYNSETLEALAEVQQMKINPGDYKGYTDVEEMMRELLS